LAETVTLKLNCEELELRLIPAGRFVMGSPVGEEERRSEEPEHEVTVTQPFYLGRWEVTQEQYAAVTKKSPSKFPGPRHPVDNISCEEAEEFCRAANLLLEAQRSPWRLRLPSEAEWEYACRAGTTTPFNCGKTLSVEQANYDGNYTYGGGSKGIYRRRTVPVGSFPPNAWGLYDMHGNVWEWCQDWYGEYPAGPVNDPRGPEKGGLKVLRGGGWYASPRYSRCAFRLRYYPSSRLNHFGFRVAATAVEPTPAKAGKGGIAAE
jgi:formylglycine-generating enzyme required for sulfatase activity